MTDHFVRHVIHPSDGIHTEYECRAPFGAKCRSACDRCNRAQREQCECAWSDSTPDMQDQGECLIVVWLTEDSPEESYCGGPQPVRGPDWQPITPGWNGDNYEWNYA